MSCRRCASTLTFARPNGDARATLKPLADRHMALAFYTAEIVLRRNQTASDGRTEFEDR
jgi:hypothetical protein